MQKNHLATIITAPLLMLAWTLSCHAADATAPTTCKDGTTSTATGRGACSGHGGVQKPTATGAATGAGSAGTAATAPQAAAPAAAPPAATGAAPGASKSSATAGSTAPAGATAKCKDGSYSKSQHHSGTCSHHGGVAEWLTAAH